MALPLRKAEHLIAEKCPNQPYLVAQNVVDDKCSSSKQSDLGDLQSANDRGIVSSKFCTSRTIKGIFGVPNRTMKI